MRNLIALFFVMSTLSAIAQQEQPDVLVDNYKKNLPKANIQKDHVPAAVKVNASYSVKSNIIQGFSSGNAKLLSVAFPSNVNISILGKSNLYSSAQAEHVLTTFFTQHKVTRFSIDHEGSSGGTKYFIGTYVSGKTKYRVTINVKSVKGAEKIKNITIEL